LIKADLGVFKDDNRPFKVIVTISKTLDMGPHGNDKKTKGFNPSERHLM